MKTVFKHIGYSLLQAAIILLEVYMYLRGDGYIDAFDFKAIFFSSDALADLRFYDMRLSVFYTITQFVRITIGSEDKG